MIIKRLYTIWCALVFVVVFFLIFPPVFVLVQNEKWHRYTQFWYRLWARLFFALAFIPIEVEYRRPLDKKRVWIYCPNHASYIDTPVMVAVIPHFFVFMGKGSLRKIPLFGYVFAKVHVPVDRVTIKNRYEAFNKAKEVIDKNRSLLIYPEGTFHKEPPRLLPFKEGAFRVAIEKQVPVVPVTIPYDWQVMPDDGSMLMHRRKIKVIFHEPIETTGMTLKDADKLRDQVAAIIEQELEKHVPVYQMLNN